MNRFRTIRATEVFLIVLTLVFIGMVVLMLGLAQDYLYGEFTQFNEITEYLVQSTIFISWMKLFNVFQSPYSVCVVIAITIVRIWRRGKNRMLEYLLLIVSILGARIFHETIMQIFHTLQSIGFVGKFHSANFPDINSTFMIIAYGTTIFLLVRHSKNNYSPILIPILGLVILIGLAIVKIASNALLPSDIVGGYVYGGVWIFFNFLLFEMFRLVVQKD
ncbi:hypothetical protein ACIFOT_07345 [Neobacillus sp. NRS-1170]|uniref:hypothetical protein n=1 Tax=Neobacillus sp. NRS-1170 TaxID=3233898 RepID=UPI003D28BAC2